MIDQLISLLGYTGSDPVVTYLVVLLCGVLILVLGYRLFDFMLSLISSLIGRGRDIHFK